LVLLVAACRHNGEATKPPAETMTDRSELPTEYPGTLVDIGGVQRNFLMRQKLDGAWQEKKFSFEAVIQKQADVLTVIGMTPFGTKAFVLTQTGTRVEFELLIDREMPFPPEYILQDINRAFIYDEELPWKTEGTDGENRADVHDETVVDQFAGGKLISRSFTRPDLKGEITVEYDGGMEAGVPPKHVVFHNGWFGYSLDIRTAQYQPL
jgi:hypothetical protein